MLIKSKEPKPLSLVLTALSGVSLGALLGGYLLLVNPVTVVSGAPDESLLSKPGNYETYYSKGKVAGVESQNLKSASARIQRRSPGPVSFAEDEINYFFGQFKPEPQKVEEGQPNPGSAVEQFNVRILGDQMYVSFKLIADPKGDRFEMLVSANVTFENSDAGPKMKLSSFRINSLPVPGLGGLLSAIVSSKVEGMEFPEELVEMWQNVRRIEIESDKLIVDVGLRRA